MKVILSQDVKTLGKKGSVVEVSDGYGRNYLIPRGLAMEATSGAVKDLNQHLLQQEHKKDKELRQAQVLKDKLGGITVRISCRAGEGGKLFGSVTSKEIAEQISRQFKLDVDRRKIEMKEPIKSMGVYPVTVKVHPGLSPACITVEVNAEAIERG